jgi:carbonic anhydrase
MVHTRSIRGAGSPALAVTLVVTLVVTLGACAGGSSETAETVPDAAQSTQTDLIEISLRLKELDARVDVLEGKPAGEDDAHATTDEHGTATAEHATAATAPAGDHTADATHPATATGAHGDASHWGYADADHWGELAAEFATCGAGMEQSPIDLTAATMASIDDASLTYAPAAATVTDNGHTVQVNLANAGSAVVDGDEFELAQFHFHAPSEHTVDGVHSPVEAHFVHKDADGNLAVIGVMIIEGPPHPMFDEIIANVPAAGEEVPLPSQVDARTLMPANLMAYRYSGSLTTPPCSEGVTWSVLHEPITWSAEQVTALAAHFAEPNNRPLQPLNYRELRIDVTPG